MIICKVSGGLGNQLFQYFNGLALSKKTGKKLYLDRSSYCLVDGHSGFQLDKFGVKEQIIPNYLGLMLFYLKRVYKKLFGKDLPFYYEQSSFSYEEINIGRSVIYLDGTFQSEKYFSNIADKVIGVLELKLDAENQAIKDDMAQHESIAIHVRRGDYVSNVEASREIGACSKKYYEESILYFHDKFPGKNIKYYIFTDDVEWVKSNLSFKADHQFVEINRGDRSHFDIALMRFCKHNIISNSTFSWMGAWGNKNGVVIAPYPWFRSENLDASDLYCTGWVKIKK